MVSLFEQQAPFGFDVGAGVGILVGGGAVGAGVGERVGTGVGAT